MLAISSAPRQLVKTTVQSYWMLGAGAGGYWKRHKESGAGISL